MDRSEVVALIAAELERSPLGTRVRQLQGRNPGVKLAGADISMGAPPVVNGGSHVASAVRVGAGQMTVTMDFDVPGTGDAAVTATVQDNAGWDVGVVKTAAAPLTFDVYVLSPLGVATDRTVNITVIAGG